MKFNVITDLGSLNLPEKVHQRVGLLTETTFLAILVFVLKTFNFGLFSKALIFGTKMPLFVEPLSHLAAFMCLPKSFRDVNYRSFL